ncbi:MAG: Nif3-like dinuclear metal center hexameric protein [Candidatus Nanopelagicales bacterium]
MPETPSQTPTLGQVVALLHARYDPRTAQAWDHVGLVCGDPAEPVEAVMFAVDPVETVVDEAIADGVQLLVSHHPLFLSAVHAVAADDFKGRVVHRLIRAGIGLLAAHTNADNARPGVSDAIATALGLHGVAPLEVLEAEPDPHDKFVVFVPEAQTGALVEAMAAAGAGRIGNYERAAFTSPGTGTFRPMAGARPAIGAVGRIESVAESMVQMIAARSRRGAVLAALRGAHPYEEPAFEVIELADVPSGRGGGRIGELAEPMALAHFADLVAATLPTTAHGVRVAGDPRLEVRRVALCGGSGDSMLGLATAAGADAYLTSDLRHHRASEHLESGGCALVDVAHWAAEWMWLPQAARLLEQDASAAGLALSTTVSTTVTDPWTFHVGRPIDAR